MSNTEKPEASPVQRCETNLLGCKIKHRVVFSIRVLQKSPGVTERSGKPDALHAGRVDTDGDGSDAVTDASVALATTAHLLAAYASRRCAVELDVRTTVGARHTRTTWNQTEQAIQSYSF